MADFYVEKTNDRLFRYQVWRGTPEKYPFVSNESACMTLQGAIRHMNKLKAQSDRERSTGQIVARTDG